MLYNIVILWNTHENSNTLNLWIMFRNEAKMPSKAAAALRIDGTGNFIVACDHRLAKKVEFRLNTGCLMFW